MARVRCLFFYFNRKEFFMANPTSDNPKSGQNPQHQEKNDPRQQQHNDPSQQHGQHGEHQQQKQDPMKDRRPGGNAQDEPSDRRKAS
jgi:hypothetical protein